MSKVSSRIISAKMAGLMADMAGIKKAELSSALGILNRD
jgi:hypothetical protein